MRKKQKRVRERDTWRKKLTMQEELTALLRECQERGNAKCTQICTCIGNACRCVSISAADRRAFAPADSELVKERPEVDIQPLDDGRNGL